MDSLLPKNSTLFEQSLEQTVSRPLPENIKDIWHPDTCPAHLLPYLAWGLSVETWDDKWPEQIKRQVCRNAIEVYKHKGTIGAIRKALASLDARIDIKEWYEMGGQPYTANLIAYAATNLNEHGDTLLTPQLQETMWQVVKQAKNARTHIYFKIGVEAKSGLAVTSGAQTLSTSVATTEAARPSPTPNSTGFVSFVTTKGIEAHRITMILR